MIELCFSVGEEGEEGCVWVCVCVWCVCGVGVCVEMRDRGCYVIGDK